MLTGFLPLIFGLGFRTHLVPTAELYLGQSQIATRKCSSLNEIQSCEKPSNNVRNCSIYERNQLPASQLRFGWRGRRRRGGTPLSRGRILADDSFPLLSFWNWFTHLSLFAFSLENSRR
jgi:hypothetical protein